MRNRRSHSSPRAPAVARQRYLKWAFAEAANSVAVNHTRCPERHVSQLYLRLRARKGHGKTIGAVARHLAEATFHVLPRAVRVVSSFADAFQAVECRHAQAGTGALRR